MFLARIVMPRSRSSSLRVQNALALQLAVAELAALPQQAVDQRGLAVIDVGNDHDVSKFITARGIVVATCGGGRRGADIVQPIGASGRCKASPSVWTRGELGQVMAGAAVRLRHPSRIGAAVPVHNGWMITDRDHPSIVPDKRIMKLTSLPQAYRNVNRTTEILTVLSKYGLADWISRLNLDFAKGSVQGP